MFDQKNVDAALACIDSRVRRVTEPMTQDEAMLDVLAAAVRELRETIRKAEAALPPLDDGEVKPLPQRIADEMADFYGVVENVAKVYYHITNGRISKANTLAEVVMAVSDDIYTAECEASEKELREQVAALTRGRDA